MRMLFASMRPWRQSRHPPGVLLHGRQVGPPQSPPWSACKRNTVIGWIICRRISKAQRSPTSYRPSSNSTSSSCRRSTYHAVMVGTDVALDNQSPIQACPRDPRRRGSGPWAPTKGSAASTSNPASMNSSSASTAGAPGTPPSDPCSASPPGTSPSLTRY